MEFQKIYDQTFFSFSIDCSFETLTISSASETRSFSCFTCNLLMSSSSCIVKLKFLTQIALREFCVCFGFSLCSLQPVVFNYNTPAVSITWSTFGQFLLRKWKLIVRGISIFPPACLLFSPAWPNSGRPACPPVFSGDTVVSEGGDWSFVSGTFTFINLWRLSYNLSQIDQF